MTTSTPDYALRRSGGPTLRRVVGSELLKLRSLRSNVVLLLVGVAFVVVLGPVQAIGQVVAQDQAVPPDGIGAALPLILTGASSAALVLGILGVLSATSEYTHGGARVTFTAVPRRPAVVAGKAAALVTASLPVVLGSVLVAFEAGRWILHHAGVELVWTDPHVVRVLLATAWYVVGWAVLGQSLGWLLRSAVGASFALLGVMFVLPMLTMLIPGDAADTVRSLLVSEVGAAMLRTDAPGPGPGPAAAALLWTLYLALGVGLAAAVTNRRDA